MWNFDLNYQQSLLDGNQYFETSPYEEKKIKKIQRGVNINLLVMNMLHMVEENEKAM